MQEKVLIVEDDVGLLQLLNLYLKEWGYTVFSAGTGEAALVQLEKEPVDIVILDVEMPGINGFDVCKQIRKQKDMPILFISSRRSTMDKLTCFDLGGDDYITKPFDFSELQARVKANLHRYQLQKKQVTRTVVQCGPLKLNFAEEKCYIDGKAIPLTTIENEIVKLLANRPNEVFSVEEIYNNIWGQDAIGYTETVKVHIRNLRKKIEVDFKNPEYIVTVRGFGYMFVC